MDKKKFLEMVFNRMAFNKDGTDRTEKQQPWDIIGELLEELKLEYNQDELYNLYLKKWRSPNFKWDDIKFLSIQ